jgi:hypothetical protein
MSYLRVNDQPRPLSTYGRGSNDRLRLVARPAVPPAPRGRWAGVDQQRQMQTQQPQQLTAPEVPAWLGLGAAAVGGYLIYRGHVERREYEARSERVRFGFDAEIEMAIDLQERGANVELSPGSRGAIDARVSWSRTRWGVQHKASLDGEPRWPGPGRCQGSCRLSHRVRVAHRLLAL